MLVAYILQYKTLSTHTIKSLPLYLALVSVCQLSSFSSSSVLPGFPGERDTFVHVYQSYIVVIELRHISVLECPDVVHRVHDHLGGNHHALTWEQNKLHVI